MEIELEVPLYSTLKSTLDGFSIYSAKVVAINLTSDIIG